MARPRKGEEKYRSASMRFRVRDEIGVGMRDLAAAQGRSIADVAEEAFEQYLAHRGKKKARDAKAAG